jgi:micrococcal nuclease
MMPWRKCEWALWLWIAGVALTLWAPVLTAEQGSRPVLTGTVTAVTDGDTLRIQLASGPIKVRLDSIDAPETTQPHGKAAKAALQRLVGRGPVELETGTQDRYERLVAVVYANGRNVNEQMVQSGAAWAYREDLKDRRYCQWEDRARRERRGLWAQPGWVYPSDWRRWKRGRLAAVRDFSGETLAGCLAAIGKD